METHHLNPASTIIGKVGVQTVANITGAHVSRIYRWMYPKEKGGTDGVIPLKHIPALLAAAKAKGIALSADDFLPTHPKRSRSVRASA